MHHDHWVIYIPFGIGVNPFVSYIAMRLSGASGGIMPWSNLPITKAETHNPLLNQQYH